MATKGKEVSFDKKHKKNTDIKMPDYHKIILIDTAGEEIETYSTFGTPGQKIKLDNCPKSHPAWNQGSGSILNYKVDQVMKFNDRNQKFANQISGLLNKKPDNKN